MNQICTTCKQGRESKYFMPQENVCVFCLLETAYAYVEKLERYLNFHPPAGQQLREECTRCHEVTWWINLKKLGRRLLCPSCQDSVGQEEHAVVTVKEVNLEALFE